jgi:hypothetical protein
MIKSLNETFIFDSIIDEGSISACEGILTNTIINCESGSTIFLNFESIETKEDVKPITDNVYDLGKKLKRFREINSVSGFTSVWVADEKIITPELVLGSDLEGTIRKITANNSIIQDDILIGGEY